MRFLSIILACAAIIPFKAVASIPSNEEREEFHSFFALRIQIENWGIDHNNHYPQHINQLVLSDPHKYEELFPGGARAVSVGYSPGNFTYLQSYDLNGDVEGYVLLVYGNDPAGGIDVTGDSVPDGVALVLLGGTNAYVPTGDGFIISRQAPLQTDWLDGGVRIRLLLRPEDCCSL